jgi:DNA-binding response OmpR family regulator
MGNWLEVNAMKQHFGIELLVVDDEVGVREVLVEYFSQHGFDVREAGDAEAARAIVATASPTVAILDIQMPGEDGLSLARWLREKWPRIGIVFLTASGDPVDRIVGLEIGADDYVSKPFDLRELLARVKALVRRMAAMSEPASSAGAPSMNGGKRVHFGDCLLDLNERRLLDADGCDLAVTSADLDVLALFARSPNRPLSREQIMAQAHNREWDVFDRSIDLRIMRLRRKIERNPDKPEILKTVRNIGYVFVPGPAKT